MKKTWLFVFTIAFLMLSLVACQKTANIDQNVSTEIESTEDDEYITIGFSQLGAESDWRSANTKSMLETFTEEKGYKLILSDGQQKQTNQIMAIRTFIQQGVDYIVLAPVTESGWDTVLMEAKEANIPVIIVDRKVDADDSLFVSWVGSNFELEGIKATTWLQTYIEEKNIDPSNVHVASIQGNPGATAQIGRTKALEDAVAANKWDLVDEQSGDFTQARGREVMESYLKKYKDINVIYCENDNMALGALEAIEEAGRVAGSDILNGQIMVISFDGVNQEALRDVLSGKISCIAECNPLHGPRVEDIIQSLEKGNTPEKYSYVDGAVYCADQTVNKIIVIGAECEVTVPELEEDE